MTCLNSGKLPRRVLFVLGSGVSLPVCPSVTELTQSLFEPGRIPYEWAHSNYEQVQERDVVIGFLSVLRGYIATSAYDPNYEDLYSLCLKLAAYELTSRPDPGLTLFRDFIIRATRSFSGFYHDKGYWDQQPLAAISARSREFIIANVREILRGRSYEGGMVKLDCILAVLRADPPWQVDVLTLNHDLLLENALTEARIDWTDGFDTALPGDENAFLFDRDAFSKPGRVRILKIHGGCDWCPGSVDGDKWRPLKLRRGAKREQYIPDYERSLTLTGSTTKGDAYTRGVFGDLNWESRRLLREHNRIVCSGYGWKDEAFNAMLKDWSDSREDARMLLLHNEGSIQEFEGLRKPWLWPNEWKTGSGWLKWHPKWLSETTLCDLDEFCLMAGHSLAPQKSSKSEELPRRPRATRIKNLCG